MKCQYSGYEVRLLCSVCLGDDERDVLRRVGLALLEQRLRVLVVVLRGGGLHDDLARLRLAALLADHFDFQWFSSV